MKLKLLFFLGLFLLVGSLSSSHDAAIALFHFTEDGEGLALNLSLDIEDASISTGLKPEELNLANLQIYLEKHVFVYINDSEVVFEFFDISFVRDHIQLRGVLSHELEEIKHIKIKNTCLVNVPKHSNIIRLDLNDRHRDFRMHKGRTEISIIY